RDITWDDATETVPAVITALATPFTFSIATGIGLGFIVYVIVKLAAGRMREIAGAVWIIAILSALRFALT
ncbi:MAG TPA: NCS2 family permease, partial [Acetobacteraceae bacterium]|nr:NCS2 family permease [Acetobacteraceae bacterium]